jgi:hypothetical protein
MISRLGVPNCGVPTGLLYGSMGCKNFLLLIFFALADVFNFNFIVGQSCDKHLPLHVHARSEDYIILSSLTPFCAVGRHGDGIFSPIRDFT